MPIDFDDLTNRILDKLDKFEDKIDDLCKWKTEMKTEWNNHMIEIERKSMNKEKRFYIIITLMGVGFTVQEVVRSFI